MLRARLVVLAALGGACSSASSHPRGLSILGIEPRCPAAGGVITLTLSGGDVMSCDAGRIRAGGRELTNLGVVTRSPLVLSARLPAGYVPSEGVSIEVTCGADTASARWAGVCAADASPPDAVPDGALVPDVAASCGLSIEAVLEAVDRTGRPFARDGDGVFLVPINADDFAFDTGKSQNVSGRDVTYTFNSDCFPRVAVRAPVLGGFSTQGLSLDKRCQFMVEILDLGCPQARSAHAQGVFQIVPAQ